MVFNSLPFILFMLLFLLGWNTMNKRNNSRWAYLTIASFVFYAWWDWRFLFLIIGSGLIDYFAGIALAKHGHKKVYLILSLLGNLGGLALFKYSTFFAENIEALCLLFGQEIDVVSTIPEFALVLPVGISFYTFQSMSYTIDIYRGRLEPTRNMMHFFSYLSMFPQLVAGPIVRASDLLKQLEVERKASYLEKWNGIKMFAFGLFQKTVIADHLGYFVDNAYGGKTTYDGSLYWWAVSIAFAFQIYCDFSGYSLMARGISKYLGYHFKMNFNHPYLSVSLKDFWRRWHISLSTWFRDYVYIPLGGSRKGLSYGILVMFITMIASGVWHGANWTFIIWGGIHAFFLALERIFKYDKLLGYWNRPFVLLQVLIAWVFFRADSYDQANQVISNLFTTNWNTDFYALFKDSIIVLLLAIVIEMMIGFRKQGKLNALLKYDVVLVVAAIVMSIFYRGPSAGFIYFQF